MPSSSARSRRAVGRYIVHDRIAAGGMATVHVGRLLGAAGFARTVAVKRLHDQYACDADFVAMLLDEARLASQVRHPNVVQTLDVVAEDDELLVVMEYIEGDSISQLVRAAKQIPAPIAASIVAQMLHGLHAAHEAHGRDGEPLGIVHRDVSPQNVLVGTDGVARVLDFGIARAASRSTSTDDGIVKGKTAYMAPEQVKHGAIDRRTDIFSAGVVLWELLASRRLFAGDSPAESMSRVVSQPIDWPPCDSKLGAVAMKALEREPAHRFQTAEEMAIALEEAIPFPRAKEVGAFVTATSREALAARAAIIAAVERESHPMIPAGTADPALNEAIAAAERKRASSELPTGVGLVPGAPPPEERTDLATVNSAQPPVVRRGSAMPMLIAALLGLVAAVGVVLFFVVARREPKAAVVVPPPAVEDIADSAPAPSVTASVASAKPDDDKIDKPIAKPIGRPRPTTKKPDCRVPFVIDRNGQKHFREECVE